jgi:hypothetical protein
MCVIILFARINFNVTNKSFLCFCGFLQEAAKGESERETTQKNRYESNEIFFKKRKKKFRPFVSLLSQLHYDL